MFSSSDKTMAGTLFCFGFLLTVPMATNLLIKMPPLQITCSYPPYRVFTRKDTDTHVTCLWSARIELTYTPSLYSLSMEGNKSQASPACTWQKKGAKFIETSSWSGRVTYPVSVGEGIIVQCVTSDCKAPACSYRKVTVTMDRQDVKFFFSPPSPVQMYEVVQFGWCAKMKSDVWKYRFLSGQGDAETVIASNYHTEIEDDAYSPGVGSLCSAYYNYKVTTSYPTSGKYVASLMLENGPIVELQMSLVVEQALLYILSATSNDLPQTTDLKLFWNFSQLSSRVVAFQLTDVTSAGIWDVTFNKYALKTEFCSPPLNVGGYGFGRIHFLTNAKEIKPVNGGIEYGKKIVSMIINRSLGTVSLNPGARNWTSYYFSQTSGLYYYSAKVGDYDSSVHFIFYQQESLSFLFQFKFVEEQRYSFVAHMYLNRKSDLYKSLTDAGLEVHFFNSGPSQLFTDIYLVWFIPIEHPLLECEWTFILEIYGSRKSYLFKNVTYTYEDRVPNAAAVIPGGVLPFDPKLYAGFIVKVNCTKSGLKPTVLKTSVGNYARKNLETSIYCFKLFCEVISFMIQKPQYPPVIVTTKGAHLSIFVSIQINCSASQSVTMLWRIYQVASASEIPIWDNYLELPQVSPVNQSSIEIPRLTLGYGFYIFNVSIHITTYDDEDSSRYNSDSVVVEVRESDPVALISGGSFRTVGFSDKWALDGHYSYYPDSSDPHVDLEFAWYCSKVASDYQKMTLSPQSNCHPEQASLVWINSSSVSQTVEAETLKGNTQYYFRLVVSKGNKTSYADQTVFVAPGSPSGVSVTCIENCLRILVPTERFSLSGKCTDCSKTSRPQYKWSIFQGTTEVSLDWTAKTTTGRFIAYMSFIAFTFTNLADSWYTLVLTLTTWSGASSLYKYTFYVNSPPKAGACHIKPSAGIALRTKFVITCRGFSDKNLPLRYKVVETETKARHISSLRKSALGVIIYDGYEPTTPPFLLPNGEPSKSYLLQIYVQVFDFLSSYAQVIVRVKVKSAGKPIKAYLKEIISEAQSSTIGFFLATGDFIKSGHFVYTIASLLNLFTTNGVVSPLKYDLAQVRESLINMSSSIMITNIMAMNQVIGCINALTQGTKEVNAKSQQTAAEKLIEVGVALSKYRKEIIGSVESESLSDGILASVSNIMTASLDNTKNLASEVPLHTIDVLKDSLLLMDTVTDIVGFGKVPGEKDTFMKTDNFKVTLKKEEKWDLTDSYESQKNCLTCFYPTIDDESALQVDAIVSSAFYEFKKDPFPWLKNRGGINTVVTGMYMTTQSDKGDRINVIPKRVDVIMERKRVVPTFDIFVSPDVERTATGIFGFEINFEQRAEWFVQFFYTEKLHFNISLHIDNITNNPVAVFQIPKLVNTSKVTNLKAWNAKMIHIPAICTSEPSCDLIVKLTTKYAVKEKTKLLQASIFNAACLDFEEVGEAWGQGNCKVGPLLDNKVVHCICDHTQEAQVRSLPLRKTKRTFFSARIQIMPNPIDLTKVTIQALRSNLLPLLTFICMLAFYIPMFIWGKIRDQNDFTFRQTAIFLQDNDPFEKEKYLVTLYTGGRFRAGTSAGAFLKMVGNNSNSQVHQLASDGRQLFVRGGVDTFLITTKCFLGDIRHIIIWHNNHGDTPSWYLSRIKIEHVDSKKEWYFMCRCWFDIERQDGLIRRKICPLKTDEPLGSLNYILITLFNEIWENSFWLSAFSIPPPGPLTRFRRLSCCFMALTSTMLASIMFFQVHSNGNENVFLSSLVIGAESYLVTAPLQSLVIYCFTHSQDKNCSQLHTFDSMDTNLGLKACASEEYLKMKHTKKETVTETNKIEHTDTETEHLKIKTQTGSSIASSCQWSLLAWILVLSISVTCICVTMIYSLLYGYEMSIDWLYVFILSICQSIFLDTSKVAFMIAWTTSRKVYKDIPWSSKCVVSETGFYDVCRATNDQNMLHHQLVTVRETKMYQPLSDDEIVKIKETHKHRTNGRCFLS